MSTPAISVIPKTSELARITFDTTEITQEKIQRTTHRGYQDTGYGNMVKFTRRHYESIADELAQIPNLPRRREMAEQFANMFEIDNPRFKRHLFIDRVMGRSPDWYNERPLVYSHPCDYCYENEFPSRKAYEEHYLRHSGQMPRDHRGPFDHFNIFARTR